MTESDHDRDGRNSVARGYALANRATSIAMQMAVPPLLGWWADSSLNTSPWIFILGTILGFTVSLFELVRLAKDSNNRKG